MTRIDEIQERCEKATAGPWRLSIANLILDRNGQAIFVGEGGKANAAFIAHAREDIPWLVAELERVKTERDAAVRDIERMLSHEDDDNGWICDYCAPGYDCGDERECIPKWRGAQAAMGAEERSGEDE